MFARAWAAACGLLLAGSLGVSHAQTAPPMPPIGAGLPEGKAIDIRGLHTGMASATAMAILQKHYKDHPQAKLQTRTRNAPNVAKPYLVYAMNDGHRGGNGYDYLGAAFTSDASGNHVVSIISNAEFASGKQPSAPETIAAIKTKYGEPSSTSGTDFEATLMYGYRDGKILAIDRPCTGLSRVAQLSLTNQDVLRLDRWFLEMAADAKEDMSPGLPAERTRCDALMRISIGYGVSVGPDRLLTPNKNVIAVMTILFFDAKRFRAAQERDEAVPKTPPSSPTGTGPAKL